MHLVLILKFNSELLLIIISNSSQIKYYIVILVVLVLKYLEIDVHVPKASNMYAYDIGLCIDKHLTDEEKLLYLKDTWNPTVGFAFPIYKYGNQNRQFQLAWLRRFQWLSYSQLENGGFCKFCVLFTPNILSTGSKVILYYLISNICIYNILLLYYRSNVLYYII